MPHIWELSIGGTKLSASQVADRLTAASAIDLMVCINEAYTYKASELRHRGMLTIYTLADTASVWQASTFSSIFSVTDIGQSYVYRRSAHRQSKDTFEGESAEFYCAARSFIAEIELE